MIKVQSEKTVYYAFQNLGKCPSIRHLVTSREGGVSSGEYASLNMGFGTGDRIENVQKNRSLIADSIGVSLNNFVFANQVHGDHIEVIDNRLKGSGAISNLDAVKMTDAFITAAPGICLFIMAADCIPLLLYDPVKNVIAAIHAGWRGTLLQIARKTLEKLNMEFGSNPSDILVGIGPSIGPCCYEVGEEVENAIQETFGSTTGYLVSSKKPGHKNLDLWYSNRVQLETSGVLPKNIETSEICTFCNNGQFFSSRFNHGKTGRFGAGIMLNQF